MRKLKIALFAFVTLSSILVACGGCGSNPGGGGSGSGLTGLPTEAPTTQSVQMRPPLLVQYCVDDTGSYPRNDFLAANQLIAASLPQAVSANQGGVTLFATAITHNTFDPANTLLPAFSVPAIPAYPPAPTPIPTPTPLNPVTDQPTATTIRGENINNITAYNQQVAAINQQIHSAQAAITTDTERLTSWAPPVDDIGTSILGCFQLAANRFQGQSGAKLLYIASDLENNTDVDYTQTFVKAHRLQGVIVHVIYFSNASAGLDQQKLARWCPYLQAAGASAVFFSDPAATTILSNVFDHYLTPPVSAQSC
ncbi:MAG: hypothetical protein ABI068_17790 [Ktedonobacterales bacterium]